MWIKKSSKFLEITKNIATAPLLLVNCSEFQFILRYAICESGAEIKMQIKHQQTNSYTEQQKNIIWFTPVIVHCFS